MVVPHWIERKPKTDIKNKNNENTAGLPTIIFQLPSVKGIPRNGYRFMRGRTGENRKHAVGAQVTSCKWRATIGETVGARKTLSPGYRAYRTAPGPGNGGCARAGIDSGYA